MAHTGGGVTMLDSLGCDPAVPFVTAGSLQSVHKLGRGISMLENQSTFHVEPNHPSQDVDDIIDEYAYRAVDLSNNFPRSSKNVWKYSSDSVAEKVRDEWQSFIVRVHKTAF